MKTLTLLLDEHVFNEMQCNVIAGNKTLNAYIIEAIQSYNIQQKRKITGNRLRKESKLVAGNSMKVLAEFEKLRDNE